MALIKFRNYITRNFEYYTEVPDEQIKRTSTLITPQRFASPVSFYIRNPSVRILPPQETNPPPAIYFNASWPFYYVEGGQIYIFDQLHGLSTIITETITHYRDFTGQWHPIGDIWIGNFAVVSETPMAFTPLSEGHFSNFCTPEEAVNLEHKPVNEYYDKIHVQEWRLE